MAIDVMTIFNMSTVALFTLIFIIFLIKSVKKKLSIPYLIWGVFWGDIAAIAGFILYLIPVVPETELVRAMMEAINMTTFNLLFIFFYLFMESLVTEKPNLIRFSIVIALAALHFVPLWLTVVYVNDSFLSALLLYYSRIAYHLSGLLIFGVFGLILFINTYKITHERIAIYLASSMSMALVAFLIFFIMGTFFNDLVSTANPLYLSGQILALSSIVLFVLIYLFNIDYTYRLPNDHYILMISYSSGVPLFSVNLKNRKNIYIDEQLLSGFLSAINSIYTQTLQSSKSIREIAGAEVDILIRSGEFTMASIITERTSKKLAIALSRFVKLFEEKFRDKLQDDESDLNEFISARDLIPIVFPFFIIED
ncbi:MAG: hypothetical protein ACTSU2_07685 [Promethearchaeota archaeon]